MSFPTHTEKKIPFIFYRHTSHLRKPIIFRYVDSPKNQFHDEAPQRQKYIYFMNTHNV